MERVKFFQVDNLSKQKNFVHAWSPRNYHCKDGTKKDFDFKASCRTGVDYWQRDLFMRSIGVETRDMFFVKQIHSARIYALTDPLESAAIVASIRADAIITGLKGAPIGVLTADCVPIVLYDRNKHATAVIHAGRKGTSQNIFFKTVKAMGKVYESQPEHIIAGLGPGIGACCYEVDDSCVEAFRKNFRRWDRFVRQLPSGKFMLDLYTANEMDGVEAGIPKENISRSNHCTACETDHLFSYRREGATGRLLTLAMLR